MKKYAFGAICYVIVVILGFQAYDTWVADDTVAQSDNHNSMGKSKPKKMVMGSEHGSQEDKSGDHQIEDSHAHASEPTNHRSSEVNVFVQNDQKNIRIFLKDKTGKPVDELEINHEKELHLIIVDEHLQKYDHLHPERTGEGEFTIPNNLSDGFYKAFVDIKPKNMSYSVEPVSFIVGNPKSDNHGHGLNPDKNFIKRIDGETVELNISSFKVGDPVTLTFDVDQTNLTPYLGAMGHVVILDEYGKQFLHVHPSNNKETIFETTFDRSGIYKIWAEFKQNGRVRAFPFVIEIKE